MHETATGQQDSASGGSIWGTAESEALRLPSPFEWTHTRAGFPGISFSDVVTKV